MTDSSIQLSMKITPIAITVRDLVEGFVEDDVTNSVTAMGGRLIVRPDYQREFVYNDKEAEAVVRTAMKRYPLGVMYFAKLEDGAGAEYEVLDGQQRIISLCRYCKPKSAMSVRIPTPSGGYNAVNFSNLPKTKQEALLDYPLNVYVCEGKVDDKLEWFEVINVAGKALSKQELRSAIYHGPWATDAKSLFVRSGCAAQKAWARYMNGDRKRQVWLETVIGWAADAEGIVDEKPIDRYMQLHRFDANADELWNYFERVMRWTTATFTCYRKEMSKIDWGILYNKYKDTYFDAVDMEKRVAALMKDGEIERQEGIYYYVFDGKEKHLSLRQFTETEKRVMYERQGGVCLLCRDRFEIEKMQGDHIVPWSEGGKTRVEDVDDPLLPNNTQNGNNGQMLCTPCNIAKSNK